MCVEKNFFLLLCVHAKLLQSCLTLWDPMDCSLPGSSVCGILQTRILEWVACPPLGDLPNPRIEPRSRMSPALASRFFTTSITWEAHGKISNIKFTTLTVLSV